MRIADDEKKVNQQINLPLFCSGQITRNNFNPMVLQKITIELFIYFAKYPCHHQACYIKDNKKECLNIHFLPPNFGICEFVHVEWNVATRVPTEQFL